MIKCVEIRPLFPLFFSPSLGSGVPLILPLRKPRPICRFEGPLTQVMLLSQSRFLFNLFTPANIKELPTLFNSPTSSVYKTPDSSYHKQTNVERVGGSRRRSISADTPVPRYPAFPSEPTPAPPSLLRRTRSRVKVSSDEASHSGLSTPSGLPRLFSPRGDSVSGAGGAIARPSEGREFSEPKSNDKALISTPPRRPPGVVIPAIRLDKLQRGGGREYRSSAASGRRSIQ